MEKRTAGISLVVSLTTFIYINLSLFALFYAIVDQSNILHVYREEKEFA